MNWLKEIYIHIYLNIKAGLYKAGKQLSAVKMKTADIYIKGVTFILIYWIKRNN